ncbi:hypothetical protein D3C76_1059540 [compost metagenome]
MLFQQFLGPALIVGIAGLGALVEQRLRRLGRALDAEELLGQLEFVELGQLFVEIQGFQVEIVVDPQGFVGFLRRLRGGRRRFGRRLRRLGVDRRDRRRRLGLGGRFGAGFSLRLRCARLRQYVLRRAEHLEAGTAAHSAIGRTQLRPADAETGLTMWALGDEALAHGCSDEKSGV